jgi:hypothetical protein
MVHANPHNNCNKTTPISQHYKMEDISGFHCKMIAIVGMLLLTSDCQELKLNAKYGIVQLVKNVLGFRMLTYSHSGTTSRVFLN